MYRFLTFCFVILSVVEGLFFFAFKVSANERSPAFTLIINQVRGETCCSPGTLEHFTYQLAELNKNQLQATFALRYDTIIDKKYIDLAKDNQQFEYAAFLEIIPMLATEAEVEYHGTEEFWYEAQDVYLIGYTQEERAKLIDTYMEKFREAFGYYPTTTVAWMIDNWSLQYLKEKYGVQVHQLTREQYGTDSYALYGGPPHYPYWPTNNWAMIPSAEVNPEMPVIVRQTITDPVHNYGDTTNTYTSQPNDYLEREGSNLDYFKHLFYQAHQQQNEYTFALIGLENSMAQPFQEEFGRQLAEVKRWQESSPLTNLIVPAHEFHNWLRQQPQTWPKIYHGQDQELGQESQAWWITTPTYRARLRLDNDELYISDLRIYDQSFVDPYYEYSAQNLGWWIVPFVLDGSRFFHDDPAPEFTDLARDNLTDRKKELNPPTRIILEKTLLQSTLYPLSSFTIDHINFPSTATFLDEHPLVKNFEVWGFNEGKPFFNGDKLTVDGLRQSLYPLLFPELTDRPIDAAKTYVYHNNVYAIAGRNPVRLVLFPRDHYNFPTQITYDPTVTTLDQIDGITIKRQHGNNGMIFIDFESNEPLATLATIQLSSFSTEIPVYFAPNCKQKIFHCLAHPRQAWWYLKSIVEDKIRQNEENNKGS